MHPNCSDISIFDACSSVTGFLGFVAVVTLLTALVLHIYKRQDDRTASLLQGEYLKPPPVIEARELPQSHR
jgi:hypothetical protein